jgi:hypothetical protein
MSLLLWGLQDLLLGCVVDNTQSLLLSLEFSFHLTEESMESIRRNPLQRSFSAPQQWWKGMVGSK